jgi:hypothetical protein
MLDKQSKIIWLMKKWILFAQSMLIIYYILVFVVNFYYVDAYISCLYYTTGVVNKAGFAHSSEAPEVTPGF